MQAPPVSAEAFARGLLGLLQAAAAAPPLLRLACQLLHALCRAHGAVAASAMFLQLSLGGSAGAEWVACLCCVSSHGVWE